MPRTPMPPRPAFIPVQGVMQAEMVFSYLGQVVENVFHVIQGDGATAPTIAQMTALAAALKGWEINTAAPIRGANSSLNQIIVRDLTTQNAPAITYQSGLPVVGAVAAQAMPGNVTVAVKWNTAFRGRSFRGRTYHIGLVVTQVAGDQLAAGQAAGIAAVYNDLTSRIAAVAGCTQGVVSYAHNNAWRSAGLFTPVTVATVENNLDSQRRRLFGRGK